MLTSRYPLLACNVNVRQGMGSVMVMELETSMRCATDQRHLHCSCAPPIPHTAAIGTGPPATGEQLQGGGLSVPMIVHALY